MKDILFAKMWHPKRIREVKLDSKLFMLQCCRSRSCLLFTLMRIWIRILLFTLLWIRIRIRILALTFFRIRTLLCSKMTL
jgi:hypothetical protein